MRKSHVLGFRVAVAALVAAQACAQGHEASPCATGESSAYMRAVADARHASPEEVVTTLWRLTPEQPELQWRDGADGRPRVKLVTWTDYDGYDTRAGETMSLERHVWTTAVPELQQFCAWYTAQPGAHVDMRLRQLLGLPPDASKDRFVELWVAPEDVFRPSPDPEVNDARAEIDFASLGTAPDAAHHAWFERLRGMSYDGSHPHPWTRLGYTYDWGLDAPSEVGLSEFVIRRGADVDVAAVSSTADYCNGHGLATRARRLLPPRPGTASTD